MQKIHHTSGDSTGRCVVHLESGKSLALNCNLDEFYRALAIYEVDGKAIQDVFTFLSADEREFLLSGVLPEEWDKVWADNPKDISDVITGVKVLMKYIRRGQGR